MNTKTKRMLPYVLFLAPTFIAYTIITIIPVLWTLFYSFTDFDGLSDYKFVGIKNYVQIFQNDTILKPIQNTLFFALVVPLVVTALAIPLAVILSGKMKTRNIQRAIFFFPSVISSLFVGYIWKFIFSPSDQGLVNSALIGLGFEKSLLLADPKLAMACLIAVSVWTNVGWHASIYIANIQTISPEYYEAAVIDGASAWCKFRYITFPMLAPAMTTSVMLLLTGSLKTYDTAHALTGGGPGYATTMITHTIITEGLSSNRVGLASAMSLVFLIIVVIFTSVQMKIMTKREDNLI